MKVVYFIQYGLFEQKMQESNDNISTDKYLVVVSNGNNITTQNIDHLEN